MTENRNLLVGFDLCNDYSQISYYDNKLSEPKSICASDDSSKYLIRTVLGLKKDNITWVFDEEAIRIAHEEKGELVENIINAIIKKEKIKVYDKSFTGASLLEKFFRKSLSLLKTHYPNDSIEKLMITIKELDMNLIETIYKALEPLGLLKDRVSIQSHSQSYIYYALSQKRELWMNNIGLFEFDDKGLGYYQIYINRKVNPYVVGVEYRDFSETLSYDMLGEFGKNEHLTYVFENIAQSVLHKQLVSTIYITGKGFEDTWADEVFKELCGGRRIFKGQNLYTKGAAYGARELTAQKKFDDYVFLSSEMISSTISLKVYHDASICEVILAKAATAWYEAEQKVDIILDDIDEIELIVSNVIKKETIRKILHLNDLTPRPNKMTRVELRAKFSDGNTCIITAKDKGFGEFYPTNNRIWETTVVI